jgi:type II secretory pathway pseudopilin PulG
MVELLVVMVIVAVLLGAGLPAFMNIAKGQGTTLAIRNLSGKMKAARSYAVTKRLRVAVLFPTGDCGPASAPFLPSKYPYASYRTCIVTGSGPTYEFHSWIDGEKWEFLPTGAVVAHLGKNAYSATTDVKYSPSFERSVNPITSVRNVDVSDILGVANKKLGTVTHESVPAIVFHPSGTTSCELWFAVTEGTYDSGPHILRTNSSDPGLQFSVNRFTGRISFQED